MVCKRTENGHTTKPSENPYKENADQNTDTVNQDVSSGRCSSGDKRLVKFIHGGISDTKDAGDQYECYSAYAIYIERKGNRNSQKKIFGDMCGFPDIELCRLGVVRNLCVAPSKIQFIIRKRIDLNTGVVTELPAFVSGLRGKRKDQAHHDDSRYKR